MTKTAVREGLKLFREAENLQAFAKVGFYGPQGSGKTTTAMAIAVGLSGLSDGAPIAFVDTETGSDFFVDRMKEAGIKFYQLKTRAFRQLQPAIQEAEKAGAILIIDSVSHFWDELLGSYKKKLNRKKLQFQDWGVIKPEWKERYAEPFINSKCHIDPVIDQKNRFPSAQVFNCYRLIDHLFCAFVFLTVLNNFTSRAESLFDIFRSAFFAEY